MPDFIVKNSNGATLGGFKTLDDAKACADEWKARYERSPLVNGVEVIILERKVRKIND